MGRTVGSRRGLPCSEVAGRDVQREQLPCCTPLAQALAAAPGSLMSSGNVVLLMSTSQPLLPLHPCPFLRAQVHIPGWGTVPSAGVQLAGHCVLGRQTVANLSLRFWGH